MHWLDETYCNRVGAAKKAPKGPDMQYIYAQASRVQAAIKAAAQKLLGPTFPVANIPAFDYALYQVAHETDYFSSPLYKKENNASGIMYAGQAGATKDPHGYADFKSLAYWAQAFVHELTKGAAPYKATTIDDYVARLKKNGYFTDTTDNYLHGLTRARLVLKAIPEEQTAIGPMTPAQATAAAAAAKLFNKGFFGAHPVWAGVSIAIGAIFVFKIVSE